MVCDLNRPSEHLQHSLPIPTSLGELEQWEDQPDPESQPCCTVHMAKDIYREQKGKGISQMSQGKSINPENTFALFTEQ